MAKYSYELKKKAVLAYLNGEGGYKSICKKYGIVSHKGLRLWVNNYKTFGDEGLLTSSKNKSYSFETKLSTIELYLNSNFSYQEVAIQKGIFNPRMINEWVKAYELRGPDALRPKKKGCKELVNTSNNKLNSKKNNQSVLPDLSTEYLKELEDEILRLRIENAYLKELRRLRLEEETLLKEQRELSTVSEENSN